MFTITKKSSVRLPDKSVEHQCGSVGQNVYGYTVTITSEHVLPSTGFVMCHTDIHECAMKGFTNPEANSCEIMAAAIAEQVWKKYEEQHGAYGYIVRNPVTVQVTVVPGDRPTDQVYVSATFTITA